MILSILCLILAVAAYSVSQVHLMGKAKWQNTRNAYGFFGSMSWINKYKWWRDSHMIAETKKEPKFFGSTTFLVFITDLYHAAQAIAMLCLSLCFGFLMGNHYYSLGAYITVHIVHYFTYKFLSK